MQENGKLSKSLIEHNFLSYLYQVLRLNIAPQIGPVRISIEIYYVFILFCLLNINGMNVFYTYMEIAVVFNFILLNILIHCFCAIIPEPVVNILFFTIIITREISLIS